MQADLFIELRAAEEEEGLRLGELALVTAHDAAAALLREAVALRAAADAVRYDEPGTQRWLARMDELQPGGAAALYQVGRFLSSNRQYADAARILEAAVARRPAWAQPRIELGLLEMQSGRTIVQEFWWWSARDWRLLDYLVRAVDYFDTVAKADMKAWYHRRRRRLQAAKRKALREYYQAHAPAEGSPAAVAA